MIVEVCRADEPTDLKRIYPLSVLQKQVERLEDTIKQRAMMCELGPVTDSIVHFQNVSHLVVDLWLDGPKLMAEIEILETPSGKTLKTVLANNSKSVSFKLVGVGNGNTNNNGELVVSDSYKLIQIQAILDPTNSNNNNYLNKRYRSIDDPWFISE